VRYRFLFLLVLMAVTGCGVARASSPPAPLNVRANPITPTTFPTSTPVARAVPGAVSPTPTRIETWSSTSPNGQWLAQGVAEFPSGTAGATYHTQLQVMRLVGKMTWSVVDEWLPFGATYTTPRPIRWSQDGRYLYFADVPAPNDCIPFVDGQSLGRVELATGIVQKILPRTGLGMSLSPNESTLAYVAKENPLGLVLRDLATGVERQLNLPGGDQDAQAGSFVWSDNGTALFLALAVHPCDPARSLYSIMRIETNTLMQKPLRSEQSVLKPVKWEAPAILWIENQAGDVWRIDAISGASPTQ
jgi:hypothetical protein